MRHRSWVAVVVLCVLSSSAYVPYGFAQGSQGILPQSCGTVGAAGYHPSNPPGYRLPATHGTVITVNNGTDSINEDVSSVQNLLKAESNPNGVTLRDAVYATNNDPGTYTVLFAPTLAGSTIYLHTSFPPLAGGNVIIEGNVRNGTAPRITLAPASDYRDAGSSPISLDSSGNVLYALGFVGFNESVSLQGTLAGNSMANGTTLAGNVMANLAITPTGNYDDGGGLGIDLAFSSSSKDLLDDTLITNNTIMMPPGTVGSGAIVVAAGDTPQQSYNTVSGLMVTDNTLKGSYVDVSINLQGGIGGSSSDLLENVTILGNHISIPTPRLQPQNYAAGGIGVSSGGGTQFSGQKPVTFSTDNVVKDVNIVNNTVDWHGGYGIKISAGGSGSVRNDFDNITIAGNRVTTLDSPLLLGDDGDPNYRSIDDSLTGVTVESNNFIVNGSRNVLTNLGGFDGSVFVREGQADAGSRTKGVTIDRNIVSTSDMGIVIDAGWGVPTDPSVNDTISGVAISCNSIPDPPTWSQTPASCCNAFPYFPSAKGIDLVGGYLNSTGDMVSGVTMYHNDVAGVTNDFWASPDLGLGSVSNDVTAVRASSVYKVQAGSSQTAVAVTTNSSISGVTYGASPPTLAFSFDYVSRSGGYLNATIPIVILGGTPAITTSGKSLPFSSSDNSTDFFIYLTYPSGTSTLEISGPGSATRTTTTTSSFITSGAATTTHTSVVATTATNSPPTSTSTGGGGVPEFPFQLVAVTALTVALAASYLFARRHHLPKA